MCTEVLCLDEHMLESIATEGIFVTEELSMDELKELGDMDATEDIHAIQDNSCEELSLDELTLFDTMATTEPQEQPQQQQQHHTDMDMELTHLLDEEHKEITKDEVGLADADSAAAIDLFEDSQDLFDRIFGEVTEVDEEHKEIIKDDALSPPQRRIAMTAMRTPSPQKPACIDAAKTILKNRPPAEAVDHKMQAGMVEEKSQQKQAMKEAKRAAKQAKQEAKSASLQAKKRTETHTKALRSHQVIPIPEDMPEDAKPTGIKRGAKSYRVECGIESKIEVLLHGRAFNVVKDERGEPVHYKDGSGHYGWHNIIELII